LLKQRSQIRLTQNFKNKVARADWVRILKTK
jgi:hypothetical protein